MRQMSWRKGCSYSASHIPTYEIDAYNIKFCRPVVICQHARLTTCTRASQCSLTGSLVLSQQYMQGMLRIMSLLRMQGSTDAWYIKNLPAIMHAYITYHWLLPQNQLVNSWSFCSSYFWQIQHSGWRPPGPLGLKSSLYAKLSWMGFL